MTTEANEPVVNEEVKEEFVDLFAVKEEESSPEAPQEEVAPPTEEVAEAKPEELDIDPKYKDKTIVDVIKMAEHDHAELTRQFNRTKELEAEIAKLTSISESLVDRKLDEAGGDNQSREIDADFILENPKEAILKVLSEHPDLMQVVEMNKQILAKNAQDSFTEKHADAAQLAQTPLFQNWITSNADRQSSFADAYQTDNFKVAGDLFDEFKVTYKDQLTSLETSESKQEDVATALTGASSGGGGTASKQMIDEAQIIDLIRNDPQKYESMIQPGGYLAKAYEEGRVRAKTY